MLLRFFIILLAAGLLLPFAGQAASSDQDADTTFMPEWDIQTTNALRFERYDIYGDPYSSPYYVVGDQYHDDVSLALSRRFSPYESVDFRLNGAYNRSEYRGDRKYGILEGLSLAWEKGNTLLPFRLNGGDIFAQQSERTIQRSLKGVFVELQPSLGGCADHSIQLFSGFSAPLYHQMDPGDDNYSGMSWLVKHDRFGDYLLSVVYNSRQGQEEYGLAGQRQTVASLAMEKSFPLWGQALTFESELAELRGQTAYATPSDDASRSDYGFFAALGGATDAHPLTYRLAFEQYGSDFSPNGAQVMEDNRRMDSAAAWRLVSGLEIEGRYQLDQSSIDTTNPTTGLTSGLRLYGAPLAETMPDLYLSLDAFRATSEDDDGNFETRSDAVSGDVSLRLAEQTSGRLGAAFRTTKDVLNRQYSRDHQFSAELTQSFAVFGIDGSISPGLTYAKSNSPWSKEDQLAPSISLSLAKGEHRLDLVHNATLQDDRTSAGYDTRTYRSSLSYTFTTGAHSLNLYADSFDRQPQNAEDTEAFRTGFLYTFQFNRPAAVRPARHRPDTGLAETEAAPPSDIAGFLSLRPGSLLRVINSRLAAVPTEPPCRQCDLLVYETPLLPDIHPRQRLVLERQGNAVEKAWLVIDLADTGAFTSPAKLYNEIRSRLIKQLGQPNAIIETGEFSDTLASDLASARFARLMEWSTPDGVVRLGIPERLDGRVRIELVQAERLGPTQERRWGLNTIL